MGHIHQRIDFTASVYVVFEGKVLLHMHKIHKMWLPPGGHIELDEDPVEAAVREAKEETGLDVELVGEGKIYDSPFGSRDLIMPRFLGRHFFDKERTHEHIDFGYFARTQSADVKHEIEGGEIKWFSRKELEGNAYDIVLDVRHHALIALEELG
ncbi:MAG TPA: NUDIX domain-containing protein [Candidatus Paceibacterota bacterium]